MADLSLVTTPTRTQLWIAGARPRTLPAAIAPVVAGTGVAAFADSVVWWKALLALGVSLALQIGVNYANDYSDGIKGTDDDRVGPLRLVGSGLVPARQVKIAALAFLALGGALGFALAATSSWWMLLVGAAAILAAWTYTGGPSPYGYRALGEVSVFVFFGLVAVLGTAYVQIERDHLALGRGRHRRRRSRLRDPRRQQPARHPDRHRVRASGPWPSCSATSAPAGSTSCCCSSRSAA